jgi:hypothetical protein
MAKWYGNIGFADTTETEPGYYDEVITAKPYRGELFKNTRMLQTSTDSTNDNVNITNQISIIADPYAHNHFYSMRYAEFSGAKWKVTNVDASQYPRLILTLGGVYNGGE